MKLKGEYSTKKDLNDHIQVAQGNKKADIVFKNAEFLDVFSGKFVRGDVAIYKRTIVGICEDYEADQVIDASGLYLVPGFIDSHVHIESTLVTPTRFQQSVLPCGTTTVLWDPHEIANVAGEKGLQWAFDASEGLLMDVFMMLSSCVPATSQEMGLETSGAKLLVESLEGFKEHPRTLGLAEMMNFPGLLMGSDEVIDKIQSFKGFKKDGHCPGLLGKPLNAYGVAGIHSCHESTSLEEAQEKLTKGVHVLIREGSCAKDANALLPLVNDHSSATVALCTDDRNPLDIDREGHLDFIIEKALKAGHSPENAFRVASFAAAKAYGLDDRGAIAPGYLADLVVIEKHGKEWRDGFDVQDVYKSGVRVQLKDLEESADRMSAQLNHKNMNIKDQDFHSASYLDKLQIKTAATSQADARVIGVIEGSILTNQFQRAVPVSDGLLRPENSQEDVLKIAVTERHHATGNVGVGLVEGFKLRKGAIATSINHDCHNIICVGTSDENMIRATEKLVQIDGGIVVYDGEGHFESLPLPIGGLMTGEKPEVVAEALSRLKSLVKELGCRLEEPFLTLSFLALPVIPTYKLTDRGLVDVGQFKLVSVVQDD